MIEYLKKAENLFNKEKLTQQEVIFYCFVGNVMKHYVFSENEKNTIKKKFLNWQSNKIPSFNNVAKKYVYEFNHNDDMTWNSLETWFNYCFREYEAYNKVVSPEIEILISDEFPF